MPKKIQLKAYLTSEQLEARYKNARDPTKRKQWRALHLISLGLTAAEAGRVVGVSRAWVSKTVRAYNAYGTKWPRAMKGDRHVGRPLDLTIDELIVIFDFFDFDGRGWRLKKYIYIEDIRSAIEARTEVRRPHSTVRRYTHLVDTMLKDELPVTEKRRAVPQHQEDAFNALIATCKQRVLLEKRLPNDVKEQMAECSKPWCILRMYNYAKYELWRQIEDMIPIEFVDYGTPVNASPSH